MLRHNGRSGIRILTIRKDHARLLHEALEATIA